MSGLGYIPRLEELNQLQKNENKAVQFGETMKENDEYEHDSKQSENPAKIQQFSIKDNWEKVRGVIRKILVKDENDVEQ